MYWEQAVKTSPRRGMNNQQSGILLTLASRTFPLYQHSCTRSQELVLKVPGDINDHNMVDRLSVQGQSYHQAPQQSLQICLVAQCWESIDSSKCQDHIRSQLRKEDCLSRMHPNSHFSPLRAEIVEQHLNQETETKMGDLRILLDENE